MTQINSLTLEVDDPDAAAHFYDRAFGLGDVIRLKATADISTGFRGFTVSLLVSQPANASALLDAAVEAGGTIVKPATKSLWGFGGVVRAPDGTLWKVATSTKKDSAPASRDVDRIVVLVGSSDVGGSRRFYVDRGLTVGKSFGSRYVEFDLPASPIGFALYAHKALAKDAGVPPEGSGSHRLVFDGDAGTFADPDGFRWDSA